MRYRLHMKMLPGRPDVAFPKAKKAIFVHGCFWHAHGCALSNIPRSNRKFWIAKFQRNCRRDQQKLEQLAEIGWKTLVIWECQISQVARMRRILSKFLDAH